MASVSAGKRIDIGPESTFKNVCRRNEIDDDIGGIDDVIGGIDDVIGGRSNDVAVELLTSSTKFPEWKSLESLSSS